MYDFMREEPKKKSGWTTKKVTGAVVLGIAILMSITLLLASLTTIEQGHVGVVYNRNGGVEKETLGQGTHFVSPLKKVTQYPVALTTVEFPAVQLATKDGKPLTIDLTFNYSNDPSKIVDIFNQFKGASPEAIEDTFLRSRIKESALSVTSKYTILEIFQNREVVKAEVDKRFTKDAKQYGFLVSDFVLGTPVPDKSTQDAIQKVVEAQQDLQALQIATEKAKENAKRQEVEARGNAKAKLIEAEAEAEANRVVSQSLTSNIIKLKYVEQWDGVEPQTKVMGSGTDIILGK